jgi:hypothetical protein
MGSNALTDAEQFAFTPPLLPLHVHVRGPLPLTEEAVPAEHKLLVGAEILLLPFALPHDPFVGHNCVLQL